MLKVLADGGGEVSLVMLMLLLSPRSRSRSRSRSRASPSDPDADVGGESMPLAERMYGLDGERPKSAGMLAEPLRDGGSGRAAPAPRDLMDPRLFVVAAGGTSRSGEPGGDGVVSTHSSPSSSVCQAGMDAIWTSDVGEECGEWGEL